MRVKRAIVVASFLLFVALAFGFSLLALVSGSDEPALASQSSGSQAVPVAPNIEEGTGPASRHEGASGALPATLLWGGAMVSASGIVVTFMVFRGEVSKEKAAIRAKKNRADYYKDLRKYNAQLRGPPRDNT